MATAIGLLILVIVVAMVLMDLAPQALPRPQRPERDLVPRDANDPTMTALASLSATVGTLAGQVGELAGKGVGGAAGRAVSAGGVEFSRGLGAQEVAQEELARIQRNAVSSGTTSGAGPAAFGGGAVGGFIGGILPAFVEGVQRAGGAAFGSLFRAADEMNVPSFEITSLVPPQFRRVR